MAKKLIAAAMAVLMVLASISAIAQGNIVVNDEYNPSEMLSISGKLVVIEGNEERYIGAEELGFAFIQPVVWGRVERMNQTGIVYDGAAGIYVVYITDEYYEKIMNASESDAEAIYADAKEHLLDVIVVYRVNPDNQALVENEASYKEKYGNVELLGSLGDDSYYIAWNEEFDEPSLTDAEMSDVYKIIGGVEMLREDLMVYPAAEGTTDTSSLSQVPESSFAGDMSDFETTDLKGNVVTQEIFADYDITAINVWATWCGVCIHEMPYFGGIIEGLPENANFITICHDAADDMELAQAIIDSTGADITTLVVNDELNEKVISAVTAFPTTIFVDSQGHVVGEPMIGIPSEWSDISQGYLDEINQRLESLGK